MENKIIEQINKLKEQIKNIEDLENLKQLKSKFVGKSEFLNDLKEKIKTSSNKSEIGKYIKLYSENTTKIFEEKKNELENNFFLKKRNNIFLEKTNFLLENKEGKVHPLTKISFEVENYFDSMNYHYEHGFEVELEKYNFDILNLPSDHPAREMQDTFFLKEKGYLLRTHATNQTARALEKTKKQVFRSYSIGTVFRNDENDATHSFQFNQIDIFGIGDYSIANLKMTIEELIKKLFFSSTKSNFRPSYFPFTEPSYEVDITCPHCNGNGCNVCSRTGNIEILGSGMLSPKVIKNVGKNPDEVRGFAAGIGLERIAMIKWNIKDIRNFYTNDIDFLNSYDKGEK